MTGLQCLLTIKRYKFTMLLDDKAKYCEGVWRCPMAARTGNTETDHVYMEACWMWHHKSEELLNGAGTIDYLYEGRKILFLPHTHEINCRWIKIEMLQA